MYVRHCLASSFCEADADTIYGSLIQPFHFGQKNHANIQFDLALYFWGMKMPTIYEKVIKNLWAIPLFWRVRNVRNAKSRRLFSELQTLIILFVCIPEVVFPFCSWYVSFDGI